METEIQKESNQEKRNRFLIYFILLIAPILIVGGLAVAIWIAGV